MFIRIFFFFVLGLHVACQFFSSSNQLHKQLHIVMSLINKEHYSEALNLLKQLQNKNDPSYKTQFLFGKIYLYKKQYSKALTFFQKSLDSLEKTNEFFYFPENKNVNNFISQTKQSLDVQKVMKHFPKKSKTIPPKQIKRLEKILILSYYALTQDKMGCKSEADELNWKVIQLAPNNPTAWSNLGASAANSKNTELSIQYYKQALQRDFKSKSALLGLLKAYLSLNDFLTAENIGNKLKSFYPYYAQTRFMLAKIHRAKNQKIQATEEKVRGFMLLRQYKEAVQTMETLTTKQIMSSPTILNLYVVSLIHIREFKKAEQQLIHGRKHYPNNEEIEKNFAHLKLLTKNYDASLTSLFRSIKKWPNNADLLVLIGHNYHQMPSPNVEQAIVYYKKALHLRPDDIQTHEKLAHIHRTQGHRDEEFFHQGIVYFYLEDYEQAKEIFSWISKPFAQKIDVKYYVLCLNSIFGKKTIDTLFLEAQNLLKVEPIPKHVKKNLQALSMEWKKKSYEQKNQ